MRDLATNFPVPCRSCSGPASSRAGSAGCRSWAATPRCPSCWGPSGPLPTRVGVGIEVTTKHTHVSLRSGSLISADLSKGGGVQITSSGCTETACCLPDWLVVAGRRRRRRRGRSKVFVCSGRSLARSVSDYGGGNDDKASLALLLLLLRSALARC